MNSRGAGYDDEERDDVGDDAPDNDVHAAEIVISFADSFFDNRCLEVKLHPGCDGGANEAYNHHDVTGVTVELRYQRFVDRLRPIGTCQHCGDNVGEIDKGEEEQHSFNRFVTTTDDDSPNQDGPKGYGYILRNPQDSHARCQSGKF